MFTPAYNIYNVFLILSTSGIPVAISKMVLERAAMGHFSEAHRVFKLSQYLMLIIGAFSFTVVFMNADYFAQFFKLPESALAIKCIAPSLFFVPLMASYRGYFQGMQDMKPTAVTQVTEQAIRVTFGLYLAYTMFAGTSILFSELEVSPQAKGAAGGTLGATAGAVGGLIFILIIYGMKRRKLQAKESESHQQESAKTLLKKIAVIALPITIGASIMPIVNMTDVAIVTRRLLASGFDSGSAQDLFGGLGFATSLVNFPQVLTQAVSMSLVPLIAAAARTNDLTCLKDNITTGLRTSVIIGLPCTAGLMLLAEPVLLLLYPNQPQDAIGAAPCLTVLSAGIIFLSVVQTTTGILQGMGKQMIPVKNMLAGVLLKIILTWILTGIPAINVMGSAAGTVSAYLIAACLNVMAVKKYTKVSLPLAKLAAKPLIATVAMGISTILSYTLLDKLLSGSRVAVIFAVLVSALVYTVLLFVTGAITKSELEQSPHGKKILKLFRRFMR